MLMAPFMPASAKPYFQIYPDSVLGGKKLDGLKTGGIYIITYFKLFPVVSQKDLCVNVNLPVQLQRIATTM